MRLAPLVLLLAACGADGPPLPPPAAEGPAARPPGPAVALSGSAGFGVVRTTGG